MRTATTDPTTAPIMGPDDVGSWTTACVQRNPVNPSEHPLVHVPLCVVHVFVTQLPQVKEQFCPYVPSSQAKQQEKGHVYL